MIQTDITKVFGFEQIGNEIFCIANPNDEPDQWQIHEYVLPWVQHRISFCLDGDKPVLDRLSVGGLQLFPESSLTGDCFLGFLPLKRNSMGNGVVLRY